MLCRKGGKSCTQQPRGRDATAADQLRKKGCDTVTDKQCGNTINCISITHHYSTRRWHRQREQEWCGDSTMAAFRHQMKTAPWQTQEVGCNSNCLIIGAPDSQQPRSSRTNQHRHLCAMRHLEHPSLSPQRSRQNQPLPTHCLSPWIGFCVYYTLNHNNHWPEAS